MIALAWGFGFVGTAVVLFFTRRRVGGYSRTEGVVVDRKVVRSNATNTTAAAVVEFSDDSGRTWKTEGKVFRAPFPRVGKTVTVLYSPEDPEGTAQLKTDRRTWYSLATIFLLAGVCFIAMGFGELYGNLDS